MSAMVDFYEPNLLTMRYAGVVALVLRKRRSKFRLVLSFGGNSRLAPLEGGLPKGVPPRRGTPEYEEWQAKRTEEAARVKTGQPNK